MATFGKTNIGGTDFTSVWWWGCKFTAPEAGDITSISMYGNSTGTASYKLCIWADNAGFADTLLAESSSASINTTTQWWTRPVTYSVSASEVVWLGFISDDWVQLYRDAGSTNQWEEFDQDYNNWPTAPNPPTDNGRYDYELSIYATYTPAAPDFVGFNISLI